MQSKPSHVGSSQKMAISRLERSPRPPPKASMKNREDRVARACTTCRKRKVRCSGEVPRCSNCQVNSLECLYQQARRDRLQEATQLNHTMSILLRDLSERVGDEDKQKIEDALEDADDDLISLGTSPSIPSLGKRTRKHSTCNEAHAIAAHGESYVTASVGSNEDLDNLDEDLMRTRESRASGYVDQNSEVQWLRSVQRQTEHTGFEPGSQPYGPPGSGQNNINARSNALHERRDNSRANSRQGSMKHITDSTFYLDSDDIDIDIVVDPNQDPHPDVAERLFNCYWETVHPSFPLVPNSFEGQFRRYLNSTRHNEAFHVPQKWRAQMNLLLAIGAKYSHLIGAEWRGDERDHLIYMTRGVHLLGLKNTIMIISGPDLELVQATAALSFYFLVIGHVRRAWVMIGVSVRLALALGLHLRNEDPTAEESRKERLVHTWWSLHSIECLVSTVTGRPPVIAFEDCTVPLPRSIPGEHGETEDNSRKTSRRRTEYKKSQTPVNSGNSETSSRNPNLRRYLISHINITVISQKALLNLYSPRTTVQSWEFVQKMIFELLNELEEWAQVALPEDIQWQGKQTSDIERELFLLKTDYWSTKILITRPCLCRLERRIRDESTKSANFNTTSAKACVEAALEMAKLFPDDPDLDFIYKTGPWWAVNHYIMQSMAVLLLEMAYENNDMRSSDPSMTTSIKKLIRWLRAMQRNDPVAARAHNVVWTILKGFGPALQAQANDLLSFDGEINSQYQGNQTYQSGSDDQHPEPWPQGNYHHYSMEANATFDPFAFQQQPLDELPNYQDRFNSFHPPQDHSTQMPFGNPFFTEFDQGAPVVNMQDLWLNAASSTISDPTLSDKNSSQHYREGEQDSNTQYPLQPQAFRYHR